jgi:hypothetical protein
MSLNVDLWEKILNACTFSTRLNLMCTCSLFSDIIGKWKNLKLRIASFDIGKTNFAQYVEEFNFDDVLNLKERYKALPNKAQRRTKGEISDELKSILDDLFKKATRINIGVFDFTPKDTTGIKLTNEVRLKFLEHMASYVSVWKDCDGFIIEQQFVNTFSGGTNLDAVKLSEALTMWFLEHYPQKMVQSFGSQYKTLILGAPTKMKKPERKKWAIVKAEEIFKLREDKNMLNCFDLSRNVKRKRINTEEKVQSFLINFKDKKVTDDIKILAEKIVRTKQKLDDVSDVVLQLQAYKYRTFVAKF